MKSRLYLAPLLLFVALQGTAAEMATGPVVKGFGPVVPAPEGAMNLVPGKEYKVLLDVSGVMEFPGDRNQHLETAARFMNMHARNGINPDNLKFALVVHGYATRDLITDAAYQKRFNEPNPNTGLLKALGEAGIPIYVCAQSAAYMKYQPGDFHPAVEVALSAMSVHVRLQDEGYIVIPR